jgi:hypothetical protein
MISGLIVTGFRSRYRTFESAVVRLSDGKTLSRHGYHNAKNHNEDGISVGLDLDDAREAAAAGAWPLPTDGGVGYDPDTDLHLAYFQRDVFYRVYVRREGEISTVVEKLVASFCDTRTLLFGGRTIMVEPSTFEEAVRYADSVRTIYPRFSWGPAHVAA